MRTGLLGLMISMSAIHAAAQGTGEPCHTSVVVLTHRNNNYRTGANLREECLTWDNVKSETFGKLFTLGVQGQVYAQPLILTNLRIYNEVHGAMETHNRRVHRHHGELGLRL